MLILIRGTSVRDPYQPPADYAEFFVQYWDSAVEQCKRLGVLSVDAEDMASEIFFRFLKRDFLTQFDPEYVIVHHGKQYRARFSSFLSTFIEVYARGFKRNDRLRRSRELLLCDKPVDKTDGWTWMDLFAERFVETPFDFDVEGRVDAVAQAALYRAHLSSLPRRGKMDLVRAFDLMCEEAFETGVSCSSAVVAVELGVTRAYAGKMLRMLRAELHRAFVAEPGAVRV
jgi:hypothetical protein